MMQCTSKLFRYLQKVFYNITKCLTSNVTKIVQMTIKYCTVVYGKKGRFTLYNLTKGKTWNGNLFLEENGNVKYYLTISVCNFESSLLPLPYAVTVCDLYTLFTYYIHLCLCSVLPKIYFHLYT